MFILSDVMQRLYKISILSTCLFLCEPWRDFNLTKHMYDTSKISYVFLIEPVFNLQIDIFHSTLNINIYLVILLYYVFHRYPW